MLPAPLLRAGCLLALATLEPLSVPRTAPSPSIERVATLRTARSVHTATTLASGQVLLAGGMTGGGSALATAELFDPSDDSVREVGELSERRLGHGATLLPDGRVLITGGYDGSYMSSVESYDPATRRFMRAGSLREGRSGHTATLLADGRVLLIGGVGRGWTFLRSAEIYDPATGESELAGEMAVPRESHTATLLADGRVLVVGGHSGRRSAMEVYASAEVYDLRTRGFEPAGMLTTPRHKHDAVRLSDGRVMVIAGADRTDRNLFATTEIFDPKRGEFSAGPSMANNRYKIAGTSVRLPDGAVLVTSGARTAEILDAAGSAFHEVPGRFPAAYRFASAVTLSNGDVMIAGGYADDNRNTDGVWRFRRP